MATVVIPFAGAAGKTRLHESAEVRRLLAVAMFEDVLAACRPVGPVRVVAPDEDVLEDALDVELIPDPGTGQGAAVAAALEGVEGPVTIVNADVPCVVPADIRLLAGTAPALVAAADGTTNALSLPSVDLFAPLYGPGSAERFHDQCGAVSMALPNLADDVDTMDDLIRLQLRVGPRTLVALDRVQRGAA
ncbi:MAG: Guanylyl transferase CofC like [Gaiellaceae bacterium]|jgi:2-phospho-L-lactate guanylyltransferase|nr:Guanylyl transferase CofC like [Gaiellaceae bacterium]